MEIVNTSSRVVKNILRAVAAMVIDIEQGNLPEERKHVCRNRGVVDETITTGVILPGVMPGRAAQGKRGSFTVRERLVPRERRNWRMPSAASYVPSTMHALKSIM